MNLTREKLGEIYDWVSCILLYFLEDSYYENRSDTDTIQRFVETFKSKNLNLTIKQGRELLSLPEEEFPSDWILDTIGAGYPKRFADYSAEEGARKTTQWIVEELEKEAKKQGKL